MSELAVLTGGQGEVTTIRVEWFNEDNVRRTTVVELRMEPQDKPRILAVRVNGVTVARLSQTYCPDCASARLAGLW